MIIGKNKRATGVVVDPTQSKSTIPSKLIVGIDAGSTQTRVCIADKHDIEFLSSEEYSRKTLDFLRNETYIIPSTFASVTDEREIKPASASIEDNYDSRIIRVRTSAETPLITSERVVRGKKMRDSAGLVPRFLDSSTNKMDNSIFYLNVLDGIGYAILQKYSGNIPQRADIRLVLSVRPKELNSFCVNKMNSNLIGEYMFRWSNICISLNIIDATYTTEPEAQIMGTQVVMDTIAELEDNPTAAELSRKFSESTSYIHIEGGGSSVGVEVVKDGDIVDACSHTLQLGGNYLNRIVIDRIREEKGRVVSEAAAAEAVKTGLLRNGRARDDVSSIISACKNKVGMNIVESLRHDVIDITPGLVLTDFDFITLGGRLFMRDETGVSVAKYVAEYIAQVSPETEVIVLDDNYIPAGNVVIGIVNSEEAEEVSGGDHAVIPSIEENAG